MRLFIAINVDSKTKERLVVLCNELREASTWYIHTSRKFAPYSCVSWECDTKQTAAIKSVMDMIDFAPFDLVIDCIGRYKRFGGDLWWAGVQRKRNFTRITSKLNQQAM